LTQLDRKESRPYISKLSAIRDFGALLTGKRIFEMQFFVRGLVVKIPSFV